MYFFSIAIASCLFHLSFACEAIEASCLFHLSFACEASEVPSSLKWRQELESLYIEAKPILTSVLTTDSIFYIEEIFSNAITSLSYDSDVHEALLHNFFENVSVVEEKEIYKLSKFFFKMFGYLRILMLERISNDPGYIRNADFWDSMAADPYYIYKDRPAIMPAISVLNRHSDWANSSSLIVDFALLKKKLGTSELRDRLKFFEIYTPRMQNVGWIIDFIKKVMNTKLNNELELSAAEKRNFFKSILLFLKERSKKLYWSTGSLYGPHPNQCIGRNEAKLNNEIDEVIARYQL